MNCSKSPQRDEESLFLRTFEFVLCETLMEPSETGEERCGSELTRSKISIHRSASSRARLEIKVLPPLSSRISAKVRTALPSSFVLVTSFQSRWYSVAMVPRGGLGGVDDGCQEDRTGTEGGGLCG